MSEEEEERRSGMSAILDGIKRIEKRMDKHSGEGQDTTHALIEERLDNQGASITRLKTVTGFIGLFFSGLYIATITWVSRKF